MENKTLSIQEKEGDIICDPASGSGGFLIRFFETVREQIYESVDKEYQREKAKIEKEKGLSEEKKAEKITEVYDELQKQLDKEITDSRIWKLANRCIYGTDANGRMARADFDYPIFMCEAERVGITSTGEEDKNELPQIFEEYKKFQKDPKDYGKK